VSDFHPEQKQSQTRVRRIYPSALILGGAGGLAGFFLGYGRGASTLLGIAAVTAWIGVEAILKHYREGRDEPES